MSVRKDAIILRNGHSKQVLFRAEIEVSHHASKKNSRPIFKNKKTGRPFLGKSADLRECENTLLRELRERAAQHGILKPLSHRLHALFIFGFPPEHFYTKRLTENRRLGDCSNLSQIVEDSLQKAGIIADDFYLCPITIDRVCSDKMMVFIQLEV